MSSISVTNRINVGYAFLTCAILFLAGLSYLAVKQLGKSYYEYRSTTQQTVLINHLYENVVNIRIAALNYRISPSDEAVTDVQNGFAKVQEGVNDPLVDEAPARVQSEIENVSELAAAYQAAFNDAVGLRRQIAEQGTQVTLQYDAVIAALWALENVNRPGRSFNEILAESTVRTTIMTQLNQANDAATQFVNSGDGSQFDASLVALANAKTGLQEMNETDGSTEEPWMVEVTTHTQSGLAAMQQIEQVLVAVQLNWSKVRDINLGTLDVVGPAMKSSLQNAVDAVVETQENLGAAGQRVVDLVLRLTPMVGAFAFSLAVAIAYVIGRWVTLPLGRLARTTQMLADGDTAIEIEGAEHAHELGQMARALGVFRDTIERDHATAERIARENTEQQQVVAMLSDGLKSLADGVLNQRLTQKFKDSYEPLRLNFNATLDRLEETLGQVVITARNVETGVGSINNASQDLSERTANQAATLEQSAAALDQLTVSIKSSAEQNKEVNKTVQNARQEAKDSEDVVGNAVRAMGRIEDSSDQISKITDVISDISFQTNLLALNAGVEAARAGEAGRGFAVVASEVRALAQRSSEAAQEVSNLINTSTSEVAEGTKLVNQAGEALGKIVIAVDSVSQLITEITSRSVEQASGLTEINTGVNMLDEVTQKNASMVETSFAQGQKLVSEAKQLEHLVQQFKMTSSEAQPVDLAELVSM